MKRAAAVLVVLSLSALALTSAMAGQERGLFTTATRVSAGMTGPATVARTVQESPSETPPCGYREPPVPPLPAFASDGLL